MEINTQNNELKYANDVQFFFKEDRMTIQILGLNITDIPISQVNFTSLIQNKNNSYVAYENNHIKIVVEDSEGYKTIKISQNNSCIFTVEVKYGSLLINSIVLDVNIDISLSKIIDENLKTQPIQEDELNEQVFYMYWFLSISSIDKDNLEDIKYMMKNTFMKKNLQTVASTLSVVRQLIFWADKKKLTQPPFKLFCVYEDKLLKGNEVVEDCSDLWENIIVVSRWEDMRGDDLGYVHDLFLGDIMPYIGLNDCEVFLCRCESQRYYINDTSHALFTHMWKYNHESLCNGIQSINQHQNNYYKKQELLFTEDHSLNQLNSEKLKKQSDKKNTKQSQESGILKIVFSVGCFFCFVIYLISVNDDPRQAEITEID